jgi:hypothetical protein
MRATIFDPVGPLLTRGLPTLVGAAALVLTVLPAYLGIPHLGTLLLLLTSAAWHLSPILVGRRAKRSAELVLGPGYVDVKRAGLVSQRIRARDVQGASTSRLRDGVSLALHRKGRADHSIALNLDSEADAAKVCEALGIGHHGYGTLCWPIRPSSGSMLYAFTRITGFMLSLVILAGSVDVHPGLMFIAGAGFFVTSLFNLGSLIDHDVGPRILLRADGVHVYTDKHWYLIPFATIAAAEMHGRAIQITQHGSRQKLVLPFRTSTLSHGGMSSAEAGLVVAQIVSAAQRARGAGPAKPEVGMRVESLARGGESPRAWLTRVDAAIAASGGVGYRGGGTLDPEELWRTFLDPEANVDLRAGAGRALLRIAPDTAPERLEKGIAAVRDKTDAKRIRVALMPDIDAASEELIEIDRALQRRAQLRSA